MRYMLTLEDQGRTGPREFVPGVCMRSAEPIPDLGLMFPTSFSMVREDLTPWRNW